MTADPTTRALAEKLAAEVYAARREEGSAVASFSNQQEIHRERAIRCVEAGLRAQAPSLLEAKREALLALCAEMHGTHDDHPLSCRYMDDCSIRKYMNKHYPLPAPAGITLSNGDRVVFDAEANVLRRTGDHIRPAASIRSAWTLLILPDDTGADFDALKAYAAEQSEAR